MHVVVESRLIHGKGGGIEQVLLGLAHGFARADLRGIRLTFLGLAPRSSQWLRTHVAGPCAFAYTRTDAQEEAAARKQALLHRIPEARRQQVRRMLGRDVESRGIVVPFSDGAIEAHSPDLVHFPYQSASLTSTPSVYHPHDLQHLHLKSIWSERDILTREVTYRTYCSRASLVPVVSTWTRNDLITQYSLPEDRVAVIPFAPPVQAYRDEPRAPQDFPFGGDVYVFYPAQTWAHKNHERLFEALDHLRRTSDRTVRLVCSGAKNTHFEHLAKRLRELDLDAHVWFAGYCDPAELLWLYKHATAVVVPSLFEAASFPVWEAFALGVPVAAARTTSLPDQVGDAGLIFDPHDPVAIADSIATLLNNPGLREELARRGRERVAQFTWERTALTFAAHYRRIAGVPLIDADRRILDEPAPM